MIKKKRMVFISNGALTIWFFLDMVGVSFGDNILVRQAWKDDGIFLVLLIISFLYFILKEKVGKYVLSIWLFMWFATQFYFHWFVTLVGPWEKKIKYFEGTIKLISSETLYVADLYHIVEHIIILFALISTLIYIRAKNGNIKKMKSSS